ncbi:MAG: cytochrome c biogenesis protein CcsA [Candidatus Omnitrophica bacterium]|nr:cytochrome c biogenesis protein CcsA [Candidatus Omnitrophota bacterium]MCB9782063.1 cytochrome c biogenesis protein CcsA [Candidatus Omnitrophota bacterium]
MSIDKMNRPQFAKGVIPGILLALAFAAFLPQSLQAAEEKNLDYSVIEKIPVFHEDRAKPLDTFARETMRLVAGREKWRNPKEGDDRLKREPMTNLLSMLFEADEWRDIPVIHIDKANVKEILGMDGKAEWITYEGLKNNPGFKSVIEDIRKKHRESEDGKPKLTPVERKVSDLNGVLNRMDSVFYGTAFTVVPVEHNGVPGWLSLQEMADSGQDEELRTQLAGLMTSFQQGDKTEFLRTSKDLARNLREKGHDHYPSMGILEKEITYNEMKPFRISWEFLLVAAILFGVSMGIASRITYFGGWAMFLIGFGFAGYGLLLRVMVAGRPPVSNMYESVVYMGWGVLLFAGIFEAVYRQRIFGLCGSVMGIIVLIMADMLPFDPEISPLVPVLRSNYWLIIHVMTIVISYSAFALAMVIAHFSLGYYLFAPHKRSLIRTINSFVYRSIQLGVLLLAAGTILGGVWANESWGRFWGWDPKETWAFISLMGYLALLHARFAGLVGAFGTAVGSILGFQLILMTWYGVNFVLAAGLHSYGFGAGGSGYIITYLAIEGVFLALVAFRYKVLGPELQKALDDEVQAKKEKKTKGTVAGEPSTT